MISTFVIQNISNIDILYRSAVWPAHFIITRKVVSDVNVIPQLLFQTTRDVSMYHV